MTERKLTDDEIINRLEQCVNRGNRNYDTDIVLDLITRQQTEIEELKEKLTLDFEKMESEYDGNIKAEAYKEFAERLKKKIINTPFGVDCTGETDEYRYGCLSGLVAKQHNVIDMVDNLLKEMVGEEE